jgi:transposase-like protein
MTEEDQSAAVGRMVTRFSEAKKRRAVLMSEAQAMAATLSAVSQALNGVHSVKAFLDGDTRRGDYSNKLDIAGFKPYPDADRINELLNELRTISAEVRQLRVSLKEAGLSLE